MRQLTEQEYLRARLRKSAEMSLAAADQRVTRVHREFADRYAARLASLGVILRTARPAPVRRMTSHGGQSSPT
ncbi:hypothetical protein NED98_10520 [Sphingomonas sp. MMSM20]|uniref:hypothetical protein n=1 Tax=Sphingomonas lycopersici TaxID=2951807 RepID=UPI002237E6D7|nr:hypothetical protein [Sphingomonas lycopersici]MCW6530681.1 hypothetical protein [Sphingomonas lycopersici]